MEVNLGFGMNPERTLRVVTSHISSFGSDCSRGRHAMRRCAKLQLTFPELLLTGLCRRIASVSQFKEMGHVKFWTAQVVMSALCMRATHL